MSKTTLEELLPDAPTDEEAALLWPALVKVAIAADEASHLFPEPNGQLCDHCGKINCLVEALRKLYESGHAAAEKQT